MAIVDIVYVVNVLQRHTVKVDLAWEADIRCASMFTQVIWHLEQLSLLHFLHSKYFKESISLFIILLGAQSWRLCCYWQCV